MAPRTVLVTAALMAATLAVAGGCGGTLEGKYRRGELTSSTTTSRPSVTTAPTSPAPPGGQAPTTTSTTASTSGNAARRARPG